MVTGVFPCPETQQDVVAMRILFPQRKAKKATSQESLLTDGVVGAGDAELGVGDPAADVGVLPGPRPPLPFLLDVFHADGVSSVGQAAAEAADLGAHHPQAPGAAGDVEQELRPLRVHKDSAPREQLPGRVVRAETDELSRIGRAAGGHRHGRAASYNGRKWST